MDKPYSIHDNLHTLSTILHSHVSETDGQVRSLQQNAQLLARGQTIEETGCYKEGHLSYVECSDEVAVIQELEKHRVILAMEIQEENFISLKLKEMVAECEDLLGGVSNYYKNVHESKLRESSDLQRHIEIYNDAVVADIKSKLNANIRKLESSRDLLYVRAKEVLETVEHGEFTLSTEKYQRELSELIDSLNKRLTCSFNGGA